MTIQTHTFGIYNTVFYCNNGCTNAPQYYVKCTLPVMLVDERKCALMKYPNCIILTSEISSSWPHFWMLHLRIALQPMADHIDPVSLASR